MKLPAALYYNFRIGPEAVWLIVAAIGSAILTELMSTDYTAIVDWKAYALGLFGMLIFRTVPAAILAVLSGGGFQKPGETAEQEPASHPAPGSDTTPVGPA